MMAEAASPSYITTAAAAAGIAALSIFFFQRKLSKSGGNEKSEKRKEILPSILVKSAPVAAAEELAEAGSATCERLLDGRQFVITADAAVADYIFNGPAKWNYVRRPAVDEGLKALGMFHRGLIWNNELNIWRKVRHCFQRALGEAALSLAVSTAEKECLYLMNKAIGTNIGTRVDTPMNLLGMSRQVTFRTTLKVFFGIKSEDFASLDIDEDAFISSIVEYFKAWEFFFLRPPQHCHTDQVGIHLKSIDTLRHHVRKLLSATDRNSGASDTPKSSHKDDERKQLLFIDNLRLACHDNPVELLEQSVLEMLLAGTDTSSVTAYYALLGLAGDANLQGQLREDLVAHAGSKKKSALLNSIVDETLRFKPVGPVVLREAVNADPNLDPPIEKGAAVLVHLAEMNMREEYWNDPKTFDPMRFLNHKEDDKMKKKFFFPFGEGPKGCIGMHLGRREVNAILETVVSHYNMRIEGAETLGSLETHWDIANQPDNPAIILVTSIVE